VVERQTCNLQRDTDPRATQTLGDNFGWVRISSTPSGTLLIHYPPTPASYHSYPGDFRCQQIEVGHTYVRFVHRPSLHPALLESV
jgi:hypothetical protein